MGSLYDLNNLFDNLDFRFVVAARRGWDRGRADLCLHKHALLLVDLVGAVSIALTRAITFACRRHNWNATCTLMVATRPANAHLYLAFGGGDLVPMRLDDAFTVDSRIPAHMYNLTNTFSVHQYETSQTISVANVPFVIGASNQNQAPVFSSFAIDATAGTVQPGMSSDQLLAFPTEIYVVGQASATLASVTALNPTLTDTNGFYTPLDENRQLPTPQFKAIPYNNLVYLVRAVANCAALAAVGGLAASRVCSLTPMCPPRPAIS